MNPNDSSSSMSGLMRGRAWCIACGLVLLWVACGCRAPRSNFVVGLYGVDRIEDLSVAKEAGFDVVVGPASRPYFDAAHELGMRVFAFPGTSAGPSFDTNAAARAVASLDRHPALFAWYLVDEPDFNHIHPAWVLQARRSLRRMRARAPLAVVFQHGAEVSDYREAGDLLMVDRYPVAWQPLSVFEQHVRMAQRSAGGKPFYAILQAFDWSAFPHLLPGESGFREPTFQELRCMTYGALVQRAQGLFYYSYRANRWQLDQHPELWASLKRIVAEIRAWQPLFEAEHGWWPWRQSLIYEEASRLNEVQESRVSLAWLRVSEGNEAVPPGEYILAVNNTSTEAKFRISPPVVSTARMPVVGSKETKLVQQGWFSDTLEGYGARVYGPVPIHPMFAPRMR